MKRYLTLFLLLCFSVSFAQNEKITNIPSGLRNTGPLTLQDAIALSTIEEVLLPAEYRNKSLPDSINNAEHEWFRPIFSQIIYPNCMQSTSIAYNFTYEINRLRGLPADTADNQYTTHFAWNFFNGGSGWFGANYLYTMDVLKYHGTPTVKEYGGMYNGGGERWMSGYDEWLSAMNNRISNVRQIHVDTEEGILTLKHWLNDHLDGSSTGGIASFIACSPWGLEHLPPGTPNAGKYVVTTLCEQASHGMTIVGYNDSIRFDYNEDGQYTNNIDLNGDGRITVSDWEIGGVLMANSHGDQFGDEGYAYMMYKILADDIHDGGIWANRVHILDVKEEHDTRMTAKIALEHDFRGRIRVRTGVSTDTSSNIPQHYHDYSIFNYQGGWHYMQGNDTIPEHKLIEFALDVTPLLSFIEPGSPCKFFLIVDEKDEQNIGTGMVKYFSITDHQNGDLEFVGTQQDIPIVENGQTLVSVICQPAAVDLEITTEQLPLYEAGVPLDVQLNAQGGDPPYTWSIDRNYKMIKKVEEFPLIDEELILGNSFIDSVVIQKLDFSFPFYGNTFDSVLVSKSGYIQFDENMFFWSYLIDMPYFLKTKRVIAPLLCVDMIVFEYNNNGIWYEGDETKASFRWKTTLENESSTSDLNFAVTLYPDGNIEFYYGEMSFEYYMRHVTGISDGDLINYTVPEMPDPREINPGTKLAFLSGEYPEEVSISDDGLLSIAQELTSSISDVNVRVTDNTLLSTYKTFQLTDALEIKLEFAGNTPGELSNGQLTYVKLYVKNRGATTLSDIDIQLACDHSMVDVILDEHTISSLQAGESVEVTDAFSCISEIDIPDKDLIIFGLNCNTVDGIYDRDYYFYASAPDIRLHDYYIDTPDGILDPGQNTDVNISLFNNGSRNSINTVLSLICDDPGITINDIMPLSIGTIHPAGYSTTDINLIADYSIPLGSKIDFTVELMDEIGLITTQYLSLRVGKTPVCIVDMDPGEHSGPQIHSLLEQMDVEHDYVQAFPLSLNNYQSVIMCLGVQFSNHEITHPQNVVLMDYLDQGGKLYMEGRVVWEQDEQFPIFDRFGFETMSTPAMYERLIGVDSTFTEGLTYDNAASQPFCYFYLEPQGSAFSIFTGNEYPYCAAVAYDGGDYKTIGTIFELGELESNDSSQVEQYMSKVLEFFGVMQSSLGIEDVPGAEADLAIQSFPNPFSYETRIPLKLSKESLVEASVYDLSGRKVKELSTSKWMNKGNYYFTWQGVDNSGSRVPGGIYIYRVLINGVPYSGKMVLVR